MPKATVLDIFEELAKMSERARKNVNRAAYAADFGMPLEQFDAEFETYLKEKPQARAVGLPWKNARDEIAIVTSPAVVDRLLYKAAITVLIAKPKVGKTTLCLDICETVLLGQPIFDERVIATSVLYISEQGHASFRAELANSGLLRKKELDLEGDSRKEQFHYVTIEDFFGLSWKEIVKCILEHALKVGAVLVVIDTLSRIAGIEDENSASEVQRVMDALTPLIAGGICVLVVQHERKSGGDISDAGRGSGGLVGGVDMVLRLVKTGGKNPTQRQLEMIGRFPAPSEPRIIDRATTDSKSRYKLQGLGETVKRASAEQTILDMFEGNGGEEFTQDEVLEELEAVASRSTVKRAINSLVEDKGLLTRAGEGKKDDPFRYRLREQKIPF